MPSIEQVSKQLFSDPNWLKKWAIGGALIIFVLPAFFAFGYLHRLFLLGRSGKDFALPEWNMEEWKDLLIEGLIFFLVGLVFVGVPLVAISLVMSVAPGNFLAKIPLIPVVFISGPLMCSALYLYHVRRDPKDCFNFTAIGLMLKNGAIDYSVPTFAFIGLLGLGSVLFPFVFFFGGLIYYYMLGRVFKNLEQQQQ